jgi:Iap family predicted aminopeptidase
LIQIFAYASVFIFLAEFLLPLLSLEQELASMISMLLYEIIMIGFLLLIVFGPANRHTANDNTSGVITLCELYQRLTEEERARTAMVFFDNEESGLFGSRLFKKKYLKQMRNKLLINFDCVSDGDNILIASSKTARNKWNIEKHFSANGSKIPMLEKAESVLYPSDQMGFPNTVAVAALKHNRFLGYYMDRIHTAKDTVFEEENIDYLCAGMQALVHESVAVSANAD